MYKILLTAFTLTAASPALGQATGITAELEKLTRAGGRIRAEFSVTNARGAGVDRVVVKCTMFDRDNKALGTATGFVSRLGAGEKDTGTATTEHADGMEEVRCRTGAIY